MPREYTIPLSTRRLRAAAKARKYRTDPEWRLNRINRTRARLGYPLRKSLDECPLRLPVEPADK